MTHYLYLFQLLLILQRYYFESESQLDGVQLLIEKRCCLSYKDTILKANHSRMDCTWISVIAVAYPTKILFWKRITACTAMLAKFNRLLLILQRYYFESESQRCKLRKCFASSCCLSYKDTILKANHSTIRLPCFISPAVAYPTKILFWKRITAITDGVNAVSVLLLILQRYYFESESQRRIVDKKVGICCCLSYKDTILKANHSGKLRQWEVMLAVAYPTKILFWKRITATLRVCQCGEKLLLILQRYYFESESQPFMLIDSWDSCCCLSYKDTILKANHSYLCAITIPCRAVAYPTKILFWKRITACLYDKSLGG